MSLKNLVADLLKAGKKLPTGLERGIESLETALGAIPAKSIGNVPFPQAQRAQFVDVVSDLVKSLPEGERLATFEKVIAESGLRGKFPDGQAGTQQFTTFVRGLAPDMEKKMATPAASVTATSPSSRHVLKPQSSAVVEPKTAVPNGGQVASPRAQTPPAVPSDTTVRVDMTGGRGTTNGGLVDDVTSKTTKADAPDADGRQEPSFDDLDDGLDAAVVGRRADNTPSPADFDATLREALDTLRRDPNVVMAAHTKIDNSLSDMKTVKDTNGKMPNAEFFSDLRYALEIKGQIAHPRDLQRSPLTTPESVFEAIENGRPISGNELSVLRTYFGRYHNDARLAGQIPQQNPQVMNGILPTGARTPVLLSVMDSVMRRIPTSSGDRVTPTIVQSHAWETGIHSGLRARASTYQTSPGMAVARDVGTVAVAGVLAFTAYAAGGIAATVADPNKPTWIGMHAMEILTGDKHKDVADYAEYLAGRYSADPKLAEQTFKDLGLNYEQFKQKADEYKALLETLKADPNSQAYKEAQTASLSHLSTFFDQLNLATPKNGATSHTKPAIILFALQSTLGKEIGDIEAAKEAIVKLSEQVGRQSTARATAIKGELKQNAADAGRSTEIPTFNLGEAAPSGGGQPSSGASSTNSYRINKQTMLDRLEAFVLTPVQKAELQKGFDDLSKKSGQPAELDGDEIDEFKTAAAKILSTGVGALAVDQANRYAAGLVAPPIGSPRP